MAPKLGIDGIVIEKNFKFVWLLLVFMLIASVVANAGFGCSLNRTPRAACGQPHSGETPLQHLAHGSDGSSRMLTSQVGLTADSLAEPHSLGPESAVPPFERYDAPPKQPPRFS